jgi:hypothetical protein
MRHIALPSSLVAAFLLAQGCAVHGNYPTHYTHMNVAAHRILADAVGEVRGWTKDDRIAIVNLDSVLTEDLAEPNIVQDALVYAVNRKGMTVVERDSDALRWIAQEGSGEQLSYGVTGYSRDAAHAMTVDAELMGARRYVPGSRYLVDGEGYVELPEGTDLLDSGPEGGDDVLIEIEPPPPPTITNDVLTATKVLEYRIVDVGIREDAYKKITKRYANVVLMLRLVDARYGTVVWTGMVEEAFSDEVPSKMVNKLRRADAQRYKPAAYEAHDGEGARLWKRPERVIIKEDDDE